jgi:DNA-binding GntR family transcriptional regulator
MGEIDARRPRTVANAIAEALRDQILAGEIPVGARLQQNDVAARFGVSSTPVREAFAELRRQGLLFGSEHRGVRVLRPTLIDMIEASEALEVLDSHALAMSVPLLTDDDLAAAHDLMIEHMSVPDRLWRRRLDLDAEFHLALLVACPNRKLRNLAKAAHEETSVHKLVTSSVEGEDVMGDVYVQHAAILQACGERDGDNAVAASVRHIRWARRLIADRLG